MREDPFKKQTDLSCRPLCTTCRAVCDQHIAWENPVTGKIEVCCGSREKPDVPNRLVQKS